MATCCGGCRTNFWNGSARTACLPKGSSDWTGAILSSSNEVLSADTARNGRLHAALARTDVHIRILVIVVAGSFVWLSIMKPTQFLTTTNFQSMALQVSEIGLLTLGMSLAMLIGGIDLSVVATANLSAILAGIVMQTMESSGTPGSFAVLSGVAVGLTAGALLGLFNGLLITYGRIHSILTTVATLMLYGGLGAVLTGGVSIYG